MRRRTLVSLLPVVGLILRTSPLVASPWAVPAAGAQPAAKEAPPRPTPAAPIPLPEHPRPDFERAEWLNLNGEWSFRFDAGGKGEAERWFDAPLAPLPRAHPRPVPMGVAAVGREGRGGRRLVRARRSASPEAWAGKRVFLVVGASDWKTTGWLDGQPIGDNQGGYTPFEMELTKVAKPGAEQRLVLRVDDTPHPFKLEGKQGYGKARGALADRVPRGTPGGLRRLVRGPPEPGAEADRGPSAAVRPRAGRRGAPAARADRGSGRTRPSRKARRWSPRGARGAADPAARRDGRARGRSRTRTSTTSPSRSPSAPSRTACRSYFGLRTIGTGPLPGLGHPYVTLNGRPVYLQMTLDQSWNADGYWNWPSDEAIREEILIARRLGLNAIRTHVKVEVPRKLYWADRLGVLVMADVPNSWGEPDEAMRREWETAFRGMVRRDFNHPSVFSWVLFNEQWGLLSKDAAGPDGKSYGPDTQEWVGTRYDMAKKLDPTRLVEDNSPCCGGGHVQTDLNSWHMYLPGWRWKETLDEAEAKTFAGSTWNYVGGRKQDGDPMLNSECGNVWGYEGSTGDVDWSFEYHAMMDEFRRHPKVAGWLYTEHHDVVNEWNGYVRADRSAEGDGPLRALPRHDAAPTCTRRSTWRWARTRPTAAKPGERVSVPLWASFLTDQAASPELALRLSLVGTDDLGREREWWRGERQVPFAPWTSRALEPVTVTMPERPSVVGPARLARGRDRPRAAAQLHHVRRGRRSARRRRAGDGRRAKPARAARRGREAVGRRVDREAVGCDGGTEAERRRAAATSSTASRGRRASAPRRSPAPRSSRSSGRRSSSARTGPRAPRSRATS